MLSKNVRKELIRQRAIAKGLFAVAAFVTIGKGEIRETVREVKAEFTESMNDSILDEEQDTHSRLSFDRIKEARERETDTLLTAKERAELRREMNARKENFSLPEPMEFA